MKIEKKSRENHPRSASDAVSLDPTFLLTFPVLTFPQTKDHMCRATWYVHPQHLIIWMVDMLQGNILQEYLSQLTVRLQSSFCTFIIHQAYELKAIL